MVRCRSVFKCVVRGVVMVLLRWFLRGWGFVVVVSNENCGVSPKNAAKFFSKHLRHKGSSLINRLKMRNFGVYREICPFLSR